MGNLKRINLKYLLLSVKLEAGWMGILLLFFKGKKKNHGCQNVTQPMLFKTLNFLNLKTTFCGFLSYFNKILLKIFSWSESFDCQDSSLQACFSSQVTNPWKIDLSPKQKLTWTSLSQDPHDSFMFEGESLLLSLLPPSPCKDCL